MEIAQSKTLLLLILYRLRYKCATSTQGFNQKRFSSLGWILNCKHKEIYYCFSIYSQLFLYWILLFKIRIPKVQNEGFLLNCGTHSLIMEVCTVWDTSKTHVQAYLPYFCERAPTKQCRHTHQKITSTSFFTSRHEGLGMPCSDLLCALWVVAFSCHNSIRATAFVSTSGLSALHEWQNWNRSKSCDRNTINFGSVQRFPSTCNELVQEK